MVGVKQAALTIGVLALQGDVAEHEAILKRLGARTRAVTLPRHLDGLDGLIIPGGESTAIAKLIERYGLRAAIGDAVGRGLAVWGTCAGMILMATTVDDDAGLKPLGLLDVGVRRNSYGRQLDSFQADLRIDGLTGGDFRAVFIRAPAFTRVGDGARVIAKLGDGAPAAVVSGNRLATAFHPELTDDPRAHRLFLQLSGGENN